MAGKKVEQVIHDGAMLRKHVQQGPLIAARIAERMGVAHGTLLNYYKRASLHTSVLRKAARALEYNFFYDLGMQLPDGMPSALDTELRRRVEELEKEIETLRIENALYEKLLKNR